METANYPNNKKQLSHSDKMAGILTEPANLFKDYGNNAKTSDWLIPILVLIIFATASSFLVMSNPVLKHEVIEKQMEIIQQNFDNAIAEGQISKDAANQQLDTIRDNMDKQMQAGLYINVIVLVVLSFVLFFIISGAYFLIFRFVLNENGSYKDSLSVFGLSQYINVLNVIILFVVTFISESIVKGLNLSYLLKTDPQTFIGFLTTKVDIFVIWFHIIIAIGYAKIFNSNNYVKFFSTVFGLWVVTNILIYWGAQHIIFLRFLIQ